MMTRAAAIEAVKAKTLARWSTEHPGWLWPPGLNESMCQFFDGLEALGLINFDEPKTEDDLLTEALQAAWRAAGQENAMLGPLAINKALLNAGFEIRRRKA